jgi:tetratricopeptide (TPR) repeat protein
MERISRPVFHKDYFTKDVTPAFTWKAKLAHRLSVSRDVTVYELPPELATELDALMRVMAGEALRMGQDPAAVESLLTDVLTICGNNQSPRVDFLVADLAEALLQQGKFQEALALTRPRADRPDPAPAPTLLRTAHHAVFETLEAVPLDQHTSQQLHAVGVNWLRRAARDLADPGRDQSLYNLVMALDGDDPDQAREAVELLHELRRVSPQYRSAWYVYRLLGALSWQHVIAADHQKDRRDAATVSARWYSRAIRARPRAKWFYVDQTGAFHFRARFHRSPIMHANAAEAHRTAGHSVREKYHGTRAEYARKRLYDAATRAASRDDWWGAYVNYDRARTSWRDELDIVIGVGRAISAQACDFLPAHLVERFWLEATDAPEPVDLPAVTAFLANEWEKAST